MARALLQHAVLVTGATSSLGRQLVQQLYHDKGVSFVMASSLEKMPYFFEDLDRSRFAYVQANLTKSREMNNLFYGDAFQDHGIDTVVHLAFKNKAEDRYSRESHRLNIDVTRALLDMCEQTDSVHKFIFRSSHQVYRLTSQNSVYMHEDSDLNFEAGANQWIRDRVDADMLCHSRMGSQKLKVVVLRLSNIMGMNVKSQLYWFLHGAMANTPMGYDPMINLLHTKDAVRAFQLAIHKDVAGVYNVIGKDTAPLSVVARLNHTRRLPLPEPVLGPLNRLQRLIQATNYHYGVHGERLKFAALMDGRRAQKVLGYTPINRVDLG